MRWFDLHYRIPCLSRMLCTAKQLVLLYGLCNSMHVCALCRGQHMLSLKHWHMPECTWFCNTSNNNFIEAFTECPVFYTLFIVLLVSVECFFLVSIHVKEDSSVSVPLFCFVLIWFMTSSIIYLQSVFCPLTCYCSLEMLAVTLPRQATTTALFMTGVASSSTHAFCKLFK